MLTTPAVAGTRGSESPDADRLVAIADQVKGEASAYGVDVPHVGSPDVRRAVVDAPPAPSAEQLRALDEAEQFLISKGRGALVDAGRTLYKDLTERVAMYQKMVTDGTLFPDGFPG